MMDQSERETLEQMPDEFIVYRGHQEYNKIGYSWTLSFWRAKWFAQRFSQKESESVVSAWVKKEHIHALLLGRNEFEIVIGPDKLENVKTVRKPVRPKFFQLLLDEALNSFVLGKRSFHGKWHWEKVERNALALCQRVIHADSKVCRLFAILHDCKRENEDNDPRHGHRAADYILQHKEIKEALSKEQMDKLTFACRYHNDGQVSDDPTIGVCWDADRLDLPRVGITPDPKYLSTEWAKKLIWKI